QSVIVEQERNRIARDMHDVVAHSLAVVIAQADGARYAGRKDPEAVDAALTTISMTAREALGDVRILLGQLRHSQDEAPQPVLADLDRLFEQFRASGLPVEFDEAGAPTPLATGAQLAVYRIVQEALTNALRHGDSAQGATVAFHWEADALALEVTSATVESAPGEEKAEPAATPGHGLAGMTERAALVGGRLTAEQHDGSFTVSATIPATQQGVPA
ncbi:MAG TPA: histidine kinase, partial [Terrimesophilobacter sp.]|nr:histidine kinase [Terrimesophilobacter sp.]